MHGMDFILTAIMKRRGIDLQIIPKDGVKSQFFFDYHSCLYIADQNPVLLDNT